MGFKVPEQLIPRGTKGLAHSSCTTHQQHNKALIATLPSITKASNIPTHTQDGSGLEGPESFPKWGCFGSVEGGERGSHFCHKTVTIISLRGIDFGHPSMAYNNIKEGRRKAQVS